MNLGELFHGSGLENAVVRMALVLMHSLWQVLLVVNVVAIVLAALGRATPNVRYTVALMGLLILPAFPLVTWFVVEPARQPDAALAMASAAETEMNLLRGATSSPESTFDKVTRLASGIDLYCRQHASWLAAAWGIGVAAFALRLLIAGLSVWRLHRMSSEDVPHSVIESLHRLLKILGMPSSIRLSVTNKVDSPAVVGWFRPLILLPAHLITGLSTHDLTHILAHELAHIRRRDYAVNLVQCVIEMLFFHHPAVWWLSHQVREEREHCCDEIAIAACGDRFAYARSLATLDDMRPEPRPLVLALGTRGGRLMNRIRRLLGVPTPSIGGSGAVVLAGMALVVVIALALGATDATAQTEEKPGEAEAKKVEADVLVREINNLIVLEAEQNRLAQVEEQARAQAEKAEQLARVVADLDKVAAELALREQKFKIAELELALEEANAMESFANDEAAIFDKLMQSGQTSQAEYMQRRQSQLAAQLAKRKAELALEAIRTGKDPSQSNNELELENATLALKAAEEALQLVEKQADAGQATGVEKAAARREAIKAKFQLDRLRLKQQHLQQQIEKEKAAEAKETLSRQAADKGESTKPADGERPVVMTYRLKHSLAKTALDTIKENLDPKGTKGIQAGADERSNTVIVVALQDIHKQIAQLIAKLDGAEGEGDVSEKADAVRSTKKRIDVRETQPRWRIADLQHSKNKFEQKDGAPEIDRKTLIIRLSIDLTGHPPTPEEVKEFVNDPGSDAVRRLTRRLLERAGDHDRDTQVWKVQKTPKTVQSKAQSSGDEEAQAARAQASYEIQLLELDLQQAENDLAATQAEFEKYQQLNQRDPKTIAQSEIVAKKIEVANRQIAVQRAKIKLEAAKSKFKSTAAEKPTSEYEGTRR